MFLPNDVRCLICSKLFCCSICRKKHELKIHVGHTIKTSCEQFSCSLCTGNKFVLQKINPELLIDHIINKHLPLKCSKCFKFYTKKEHFSEVDDCMKKIIRLIENENMEPVLETILETELNKSDTNEQCELKRVKENECSDTHAKHLTPQMSINSHTSEYENLKINNSEKSLIVFDSRYSNSSINKTYSPKRIVRTTSTPMQYLLEGTKSQTTFNSSCHNMSSIGSIKNFSDRHSSTDSDNSENISPPVDKQRSNSSIEVSSIGVKRTNRIKLPGAATPLRQVMSKSIQRALAQHGIRNMYEPIQPSKLVFDSSSSLNRTNSSQSPLDLRTTPALRRCKSNNIIPEFRNERTTNNIFSLNSEEKRNLNNIQQNESSKSNYLTCTSIENFEEKHLDTLMTPKNSIPTNIKKAISFTSPPDSAVTSPTENGAVCENYNSTKEAVTINESSADVWHTPCALPIRSFSCSIVEVRKTFEISTNVQSENDDSVFVEKITSNNKIQKFKETIKNNENFTGKLWSIVTSVMRIASFGGGGEGNGTKRTKNEGKSFLQKYASFSGVIDRNNSEPVPSEPVSKRRKIDDIEQNFEFQRRKIQGRQPINRRRK